MSVTLNLATKTLFDTEVKKVYQEGHSLNGLVRQKSIPDAASISFPVMGRGVAYQKAIHADVIPSNVVHAPVTATMQNWHSAEYTDIFLRGQTAFDEVTELAGILRDACGRRLDFILIAAMNAASTTTIAKTVGGANGMNYAKFLKVMETLDEAGVPADGRTIIMDHAGYRQLLTDDKFISSDYGQMRLDGNSQGNKKPYLGFDIVTINSRTETDGSVIGLPISTNDVTCFGFHRDAVGLGMNMDITSSVDWIAEKQAHLTVVKFSAGAVAIDATGIVKCVYDRTV